MSASGALFYERAETADVACAAQKRMGGEGGFLELGRTLPEYGRQQEARSMKFEFCMQLWIFGGGAGVGSVVRFLLFSCFLPRFYILFASVFSFVFSSFFSPLSFVFLFIFSRFYASLGVSKKWNEGASVIVATESKGGIE